jgi:phage-related protein
LPPRDYFLPWNIAKKIYIVAWIIETLDEIVDEELEALPVDLRARFVRLCEVIQAVGIDRLGMPHVRYLRNALWEMRLKGRSGIARAIYVAGCQRIVVLRVFVKKSDKTPASEIKVALNRARRIR